MSSGDNGCHRDHVVEKKRKLLYPSFKIIATEEELESPHMMLPHDGYAVMELALFRLKDTESQERCSSDKEEEEEKEEEEGEGRALEKEKVELSPEIVTEEDVVEYRKAKVWKERYDFRKILAKKENANIKFTEEEMKELKRANTPFPHRLWGFQLDDRWIFKIVKPVDKWDYIREY